jgi:hypothetical protein
MIAHRLYWPAFAAMAAAPLPACAQQIGSDSGKRLEEFLDALPIQEGPAGGPALIALAGRDGDARWLTVQREWLEANDLSTVPERLAAQGGVGRQASLAAGNAAATLVAGRQAKQNSGGHGFSGGSGGGSRASVGATSIHASARNVTTTANRGNAETSIGVRESGSGRADITATADGVITEAIGGDATTKIGVRSSGGGSTTVSAGETITRSVVGSATTEIGGETGVVRTGITYNEGGSISIGSGGIKRNGMKCLEIFRQTCIIQIYYRRHSDPCAPGYWMDFRRCLLPADLKHRIVE